MYPASNCCKSPQEFCCSKPFTVGVAGVALTLLVISVLSLIGYYCPGSLEGLGKAFGLVGGYSTLAIGITLAIALILGRSCCKPKKSIRQITKEDKPDPKPNKSSTTITQRTQTGTGSSYQRPNVSHSNVHVESYSSSED